jgi:tryptophanyl-tRNA synthetase
MSTKEASEAPQDAGEKKEKKPRPPPPPPPAALATASLIIRGAAAKVLGFQPGPSGGELQPVWVNEPGFSKVTMLVQGCKRSLSKDDEHDALIEAIQQETNRLVELNATISVFELDRSAAETEFGDAICDPNVKPDESNKVRLAYVPGAALVPIPKNWSLCGTTNACGTVTFSIGVEAGSKKKPDTMILKKKQMMIRYKVANADASGDAADNGKPSSDIAKELNIMDVRVKVPGIDDSTAASGYAAETKEKPAEAAPGAEEEGVVNPWEVTGKIDYRKLIEQFGSTEITPQLLERIKKLTVGKGNVDKLHPWLERGIFFSHRDLEHICTCVESGKPFYLYTGRGPSSAAMHLGHLIPFMMTKWLQQAFDVPLVIQMTDDEKFLWKGEYDPEKGDNLMHYRHLTTENAKDIIACGFDKKKTFIFSDLEYVGHMYPNIVRIWKAVTYNTARGAFGFVGESNIGQSAFPAIQAAPSFPSSFRVPLKGQNHMACLIPCAIDQDPYFRVTRDIAHRMVPTGHPLKGKPALLHSKFFPPLQGASGKMSASNDSSAIFLTDSPEMIDNKIKKYAFSGGRVTAKEQRELGADLDVDVSYQWLRFFLHDDQELEKIGKDYGSGQGDFWNTGSVKTRLVAELQKIVGDHQERRSKVSDEEVAEWMAVRELTF